MFLCVCVYIFCLMHGFDVIFFEFFFFFLMVEKMDRYQRVEKPKADTPIDENEIRITSQGRMRNYITYAMSLLHVFLCALCFSFSAW